MTTVQCRIEKTNMKRLIKRLLGNRVSRLVNLIWRPQIRAAQPYFDYDKMRCIKYSGAFSPITKGKMLSKVIIAYHVVEKGLTMPNRRLEFGKDAVCILMNRISDFEGKFGIGDRQVDHATGVVKAYWDMHAKFRSEKCGDGAYWDKIAKFLSTHRKIPSAIQPHVTSKDFYRNKTAAFPEFARARHTVRHYSDVKLSADRIIASVEVARSTPSACNRQYCRVYCLSNKAKILQLLTIQGGSRGFGYLADKLLIVVSDIEGICGVQERNDVFTNGGMFLMNLCYALYYNEVAHCILNWSRTPEDDIKLREIIKIRPSESVIAILTCGVAPEEFDVAMSPRKEVGEILEFLD